jgi:hypothetical protein
MKRRLLNLLTVLSLMLCVAVCVLWVRSHWTSDLFHLRTRDRFFYASTYRGRLKAGTWLRRDHDPSSLVSGYHPFPVWHYDPIWAKRQSVPHPHLLGFHYWPAPGGSIASAREFAIPAALPLALGAAAPAAWLQRRVRRRGRRRSGLCPACGYDLRATPGRCPECGTVAPETVAT